MEVSPVLGVALEPPVEESTVTSTDSQACHPIRWIIPGPGVGLYRMKIHVRRKQKPTTVVTGTQTERMPRKQHKNDIVIPAKWFPPSGRENGPVARIKLANLRGDHVTDTEFLYDVLNLPVECSHSVVCLAQFVYIQHGNLE